MRLKYKFKSDSGYTDAEGDTADCLAEELVRAVENIMLFSTSHVTKIRITFDDGEYFQYKVK